MRGGLHKQSQDFKFYWPALVHHHRKQCASNTLDGIDLHISNNRHSLLDIMFFDKERKLIGLYGPRGHRIPMSFKYFGSLENNLFNE